MSDPREQENPFRVGDEVYFCPQTIGYGYLYGIDRGVPAVVSAVHRTRCTITFNAKDGTPVQPRHVSFTNLTPRKSR